MRRYCDNPDIDRRLISKDRHESAAKALRKLRGKRSTEEEIQWEIDALASCSSNEGKGSWKEVFSKENDNRVSL